MKHLIWTFLSLLILDVMAMLYIMMSSVYTTRNLSVKLQNYTELQSPALADKRKDKRGEELRSTGSARIYQIHWFNKPEWLKLDWLKLTARCRNSYTLTAGNQPITDKDVVIFHGVGLRTVELPKRPIGQPWVIYIKESPINLRNNFQLWKGVFNWTMTHRIDSDIQSPYGEIISRRKTNLLLQTVDEAVKNKSKMAAWAVSHCHTSSIREQYIKLLKSYNISVDIFGSCGRSKCGRTDNCFKMIHEKYKFYMSLENAFSRDYVTEKFFRPFKQNIIPIVRGGANYSKLFPPGTFIDTSDFKHVKDLADFMGTLNSDDTLYKAYLERKVQYTIATTPFQTSFCRLCDRLDNMEKYQRIYDDIDVWYGRSNPQDINDIR